MMKIKDSDTQTTIHKPKKTYKTNNSKYGCSHL